jgi:phosphatidylserine/phosphatidylglycerophosphate/cardiolipin synthase-like enzyme
MRTRSERVDGYQVTAVAGTDAVSFAIDAGGADTAGLLGFAVERIDPAKHEHYYMYGFKVFPSVFPDPAPGLTVSTYDQPVQSFVWDDFTAEPDHAYEYRFHPLKGAPKNLDRSARPVPIGVHTEPLFTNGTHDVFFNRGVVSSQAYERRFGNQRPDSLAPPSRQTEAFAWLGRDLPAALLRFVASAQPGDGLLCCFYEFRFQRVADALAKAIVDGVDVRLIVDAKENGKPGKEPFPRDENLATIAAAGIPPDRVTLRTARPANIQHNKFMVLLRAGAAAEVWTGSTNLSEGGIYGQLNVGHWLRDPAAAAQFERYWQVLAGDPGGTRSDDTSTKRRKNAVLYDAVEQLLAAPVSAAEIAPGVTPVFSPRRGSAVLDLYTALVDDAQQLSCITLAFGIGRGFKLRLQDNTGGSHLAFFLLERRDLPDPRSTQPFINLNARNNVYEAWGSYLKEPLHQWARETWTKALKLNQHVAFIHSKFLLADPLGADPIVITGSANFSDASTNDNDENMLVIRGDKRVADIYFTEFNRLFNHYYFRSVREATSGVSAAEAAAQDLQTLFLAEDDSWLKKYGGTGLRAKRVQAVTGAVL